LGDGGDSGMVTTGPVPLPADWIEHVNQPLTEAELARMRECVNRGAPYGEKSWVTVTATGTASKHPPTRAASKNVECPLFRTPFSDSMLSGLSNMARRIFVTSLVNEPQLLSTGTEIQGVPFYENLTLKHIAVRALQRICAHVGKRR